MTRAILLNAYGGPEQLRPGTVEPGPPGPGEVRIRHTGIGVNYIDTYLREGLYPVELPAVIGYQGAGVVQAVGPEVTAFAPGDRVAYASCVGAYVEERNIAARELVLLPGEVADEVAAASLLRGMAAEYLVRRVHALGPGQTAIVHAAAGGTGRIVCQWAKHLGARVIATVGAPSKLERAREAGADHVLLHDAEDFVARVREITGGRGVDVVYDSIGRTTFTKSLESLRPRGLMVAYGNASGAPEPFDVLALARLGSLFLTRPRLVEYIAERAEMEQCAARFFEVLTRGVVDPGPVERFALEDAPAAHVHLEDRAAHTIPILVP